MSASQSRLFFPSLAFFSTKTRDRYAEELKKIVGKQSWRLWGVAKFWDKLIYSLQNVIRKFMPFAGKRDVIDFKLIQDTIMIYID